MNDHFPCITKQASAFFDTMDSWSVLGLLIEAILFSVVFNTYLWLLIFPHNLIMHWFTSLTYFIQLIFFREYDEGGKTRVETTFSYCK